MCVEVYRSIYRKNEFEQNNDHVDIDNKRKHNFKNFNTIPLLKIYNNKYDARVSIKSICLDCEEMFYQGMVRGYNIEFRDLLALVKYYTKKYDSLECLLNSNININAINENKDTMLIFSSRKGYTEVVKKLIYAGCDFDILNNSGNTALILASQEGHTKIVKKLISAGCSLNISNNYGNTALILASSYCHIEIVERLICAGCALDIMNNNGNTALSEVYLSIDSVFGNLMAIEKYKTIIYLLINATKKK